MTYILNALFTVLFIFSGPIAFSQDEIKYITPPPHVDDLCKIQFENIVAQAELCKLKLTFENKSKDTYFVFRTMETGFEYSSGTYYTTSKKSNILVGPNDKGSKVVASKGDHNYLVPEFNLHPKAYLGVIPEVGVDAGVSNVSDGDESEFTFSNVKVTLKKVQLKKGKFSFKATYELIGDELQILHFDPSSIVITSKNGDVVEPDKISDKIESLEVSDNSSFSFDIETEESEFNINWGNAFKVVVLEDYPLPYFKISNKSSNAPIMEKSDGIICDDFITMKESFSTIRCTVIEITKDEVIYKKCSDYETEIQSVSSISKMSILGVQFSDGYLDHYDFTGDNKKKGLNTVRKKKEMVERHKAANKDMYKK